MTATGYRWTRGASPLPGRWFIRAQRSIPLHRSGNASISRQPKILIYSSAFHPDIGGVEFVSRTIAEILSENGYGVTLVTRTPSRDIHQYPLVVIRNPSPFALLRAYRESDVVLHMNVSLRALWPLMIFKRPFIVVQTGL